MVLVLNSKLNLLIGRSDFQHQRTTPVVQLVLEKFFRQMEISDEKTRFFQRCLETWRFYGKFLIG
jgi:hypothetical protein